ncbi:MAG TPA: hypothetical protein VF060_01835 [Trebonia sp.]
MRPAVLLGEYRHAEGERVHAGEHLPARAQHPRDLGHDRLGGQVPRQRAVLGDDAVRAAVGEELQPEAVGCDSTQPALARLGGRRPGAGSDDAQHRVPRAGGCLRGSRPGAGYVDDASLPAGQPGFELSACDGGVEPRVVSGGTGVAHGAGRCLHGIYSWPGARSGGTHTD